MLERLLPRRLDNDYRGAKSALWLLGLLAAVKMAMGLNCILNGRTILRTADGVPLDTYPAAAAQTITAFFAIWAWGLVLFGVISVLALVRYRSMTTLAFTLLLVEHLGRKLILNFIPVVRSDAAPASAINLALLTLTAAGLVLSVVHRRSSDWTPARSDQLQ